MIQTVAYHYVGQRKNLRIVLGPLLLHVNFPAAGDGGKLLQGPSTGDEGEPIYFTPSFEMVSYYTKQAKNPANTPPQKHVHGR